MKQTGKPLILCTTILIEKSPQALPLGAACIASAIKHDRMIKDKADVMLSSISAEDPAYLKAESAGTTGTFIASRIMSGTKPSFICFSVYVWNRDALEKAADEIKRSMPSVVCIAGGPEITADPFSSSFDYTVAGEGEKAVPELIGMLLSGNDAPAALPQGVYAPKKNQPHDRTGNVVHAIPPDTQTIASPWLDGTIDPSAFGGVLWELARGCPFKCSYCYESKGESKVRFFPMERIEKELDFFAEKKVPQVFVLDPTYNADKKRALMLLHLLAKKTPDTFYYFECRAEFIDRELAQAFTSIPCSLQIGLQSMHTDVLKLVHRTLDKKLFIRNVGYLNESGVIFGFDLIYGLPGDSLDGFKESIDFAMTLYPNNLELFCLSVLPGTNLHDEGIQLHIEWEQTPPYHVIRTDAFPDKDIRRAEQLSLACELFYNQGRAVPWFNAAIRPLHCTPSAFFSDFAAWQDRAGGNALHDAVQKCMAHEDIEQIQLAFIKELYTARKLGSMLTAVQDIIRLNGALSRTESDGTEQTIQVHFHPDDIMSEYATDICYFAKHARQQLHTVRTFMTGSGADWKTIR